MVFQGTKIKSQDSVRYWRWTIPNIKGSDRLKTVSTSRDCSWLCLKLNKSDECCWKCQNRNKCPDVSGLCPSSASLRTQTYFRLSLTAGNTSAFAGYSWAECSLSVVPRFQVLNLKVAFYTRANFKWSENQHWSRVAGMSRIERWDAFPASSSVCSDRRVWSRGPARRLRYVL